MHRRQFLAASTLGGAALGLLGVTRNQARAEPIPEEFRDCVKKGLEWLAKQQSKDGHFEAFGGQYPVTMTGVGGMAMLMEGSTIREGKYRDNIRRATDWLMSRCMPNGMVGNPNIPGEAGRYMYGHGFGLMFLASVYGEEEETDRRKKLEEIIVKGCEFSHAAQTNRGGWGYVSAKEGSNFDEGSVTVTQVQALRAARNAGVKVPDEAIKKSVQYLDDSSKNAGGGVVYSLGGGGGGDGRPALTAAAIACAISSGDYTKNPLVKKWFKFCRDRLKNYGDARMGHDEYTHYYYAQAVYMLGDEGWSKMFPGDPESERVTWSKYRANCFKYLKQTQAADGSWTGGHVGPIFITAVHLTMLQLDNAVLPIYQR